MLVLKNPPTSAADRRDAVGVIPGEDPVEEGMATHSSTLAWRFPWTEEPGGLQSMGLHRLRRDWSKLAGHKHLLANQLDQFLWVACGFLTVD